MRPTMHALEARRLLAFDIQLSFANGVGSTAQAYANAAASRWEQVITGEVPDVPAGAWGAGVDDVRINVQQVNLDGGGGTLAQAQINYVRTGSRLPITATIQYDSADGTNSSLQTTLLHEMGHALGFGALWEDKNLIAGSGGSNPLFTGQSATQAYRQLSGNSSAPGVPVENQFGTGSANVHWRESTFQTELMTSILSGGAQLSRVTVAQFADLGYAVNYNAADGYNLPGSGGSNGSISGTVYTDFDRDGFRDASDAAAPGRTVYLDANNNALLDAGERATSTNGSGYYQFSNLAAGTYKVRQVMPGGFAQTAPTNNFGQNATVNNNAVGGRDFGSNVPAGAPAGNIRGTLFNDANANGQRNSGENGIAHQRVFLDYDNDKVRDGNEPQTYTAADGTYRFAAVANGTYKMRVALNAGLAQTYPSFGYGQNPAVSNGASVSGIDFGARYTSSNALAARAPDRVAPLKRESFFSVAPVL